MKYTRKKVQNDRFNPFIRLRDSEEYDFNFFKCISCHQVKAKSHCQAGHYYHITVSGALTLDEVNLNGQCDGCNLRMGADPDIVIGYKEGLVEKYGPGVFDYLDSKKKNKVRYDQVNLKALYDHYTEQAKLLESGRYVGKLRFFK